MVQRVACIVGRGGEWYHNWKQTDNAVRRALRSLPQRGRKHQQFLGRRENEEAMLPRGKGLCPGARARLQAGKAVALLGVGPGAE